MDPRTHRLKNILILCAILLLGLALRIYSINFPSIGYHNMKENEYLSMAQEMKRTEDFITRRVYYYNAFEEDPTMRYYPQPPLVSYQTLIAWRLLGENLWAPRLFNILFGTLSILVIYFISLLLFRNVAPAFFSAFLLAIMPLAVFFSRNLQPESPGFFFMILGNLFYLKFAASLKKHNLILGGLSFSVAWLYKFSFLVGVVPFIFCFPFMTMYKEKKEFFKSVLAFLMPFLVIAVAAIWLKRIGQWEWESPETVMARIKLLEIFTPAYWAKGGRMIWRYVKGENFTLVYVITALLGITIAAIRRKGLLDRYIIGWALAVIPYCMIFSDFITQHNYYQMPFLPLVCISSVCAVTYIPDVVTIKKVAKKILLLCLMLAIAGTSAPLAYNSIRRMYATVFFGLDVAGESLREFTQPDERIFLLTHAQGYGMARYARRYVGWTDDLEDFKDKEKRFNVNYACFYPAEFALALKGNNPSLFDYIKNNYHVKEVGFVEEQNKLHYLILERGEGADSDTFLRSFSGPKELRTIYRMHGKYIFFYAIRPPAEKTEKQN